MCLMFCLYDTSLLSVCFHFICQLLPLSSSRSLCLSLHLTSVVGIFASIRLKTLPCEVTPKSFSLHPLTSAIFLALSLSRSVTLCPAHKCTRILSLSGLVQMTHTFSLSYIKHTLSHSQAIALKATISLTLFLYHSFLLFLSLCIIFNLHAIKVSSQVKWMIEQQRFAS